MTYTFTLNKNLSKENYWIVTTKQAKGLEVHFENNAFNDTKRIFFTGDNTYPKDQVEVIMRQMVEWLVANYFDILTPEEVDFKELPISRQFELAMADADTFTGKVAVEVGCKLSRIKHIVEGRYETINLAMFLDAVDKLGYGVVLYKKDEDGFSTTSQDAEE
mgnify:CR=1 FL=1